MRAEKSEMAEMVYVSTRPIYSQGHLHQPHAPLRRSSGAILWSLDVRSEMAGIDRKKALVSVNWCYE